MYSPHATETEPPAITDDRAMKKLFVLIVSLFTIATLSSGCTPAYIGATIGSRASQLNDLKPYAAAKNEIPSSPPGYTRIFVYRPQAFIGMSGTAVVIVDGRWMGDSKHSFDNNLLLPGAVFIVDTPSDVARVWWYQWGKGEETDRALSLRSTDGRTWYLRWGMKPTYGYLEITAEEKAVSEIESLRFSGYVRLEGP
jgi:hypothetical protein